MKEPPTEAALPSSLTIFLPRRSGNDDLQTCVILYDAQRSFDFYFVKFEQFLCKFCSYVAGNFLDYLIV
ncbi:hypothetical protein SAMN05216367_0344 [Tardiphaga sp. OK245]|nr:hypothetical protein SAMN05216367_0344 [Tardiphaga sp. OK245]